MLDDINKELDYNEITAIIDKLSNNNLSFIQFLGGEPLQRKDFVDILQYLESNNINYGFNTNGLLLNSANFLNYIINSKNLSNIIISLDGPNSLVNDEIRGKKVFSNVVTNITNLNKIISEYSLNVKLKINMVVSKKNIDLVIDMFDFCIDNNISEISLLEYLAEGFGTIDDCLTHENIIDLSIKIAKNYSNYKDKLNITPQYSKPIIKDYIKKLYNLEFPDVTHFCGAGLSFLYIDNKGQLYPCDRYANKVIGRDYNLDYNINYLDFESIWKKQIFNEPYENIKSNFYNSMNPCSKCSYFSKTCFPCYIYKNSNIVFCEKIMEALDYETLL